MQDILQSSLLLGISLINTTAIVAVAFSAGKFVQRIATIERELSEVKKSLNKLEEAKIPSIVSLTECITLVQKHDIEIQKLLREIKNLSDNNIRYREKS